MHHILSGVIKLKQREFLALKKGNMSVNEYLDKFTQLSRYASDEVDTNPKRQERFLDSLIEPLNYQLQSHSFPDFATLVNKAIGLENKREKLGEQKRKFQSRGQSATHVPASTHHRVLSLVLVDQVEIICKILSCSVQPSSSNISANKHQMFQNIIEIAQVHQYETTLKFTLMVASIVENWNDIPTFSQIVTSRLPKKTMVKGSDNQHLRYTMDVQILRSTRVNGITCVASEPRDS
jgi:hypothetical protein